MGENNNTVGMTHHHNRCW